MKQTHTILFLFILFLLIRLLLIVNLPPFTDESLFIRWGLLMIDNPFYRWASITHLERQPLALWAFGTGAKALGNPLLGARLITLLISIPSFFAFYAIAKQILTEKNARIALVLFSLTPILVLLQSLALMDGIILSLAVVLCMIVLRYQKKQSLGLLILMGIILGILLWVKTTAVVLIMLTGVSAFVICLKQKQSMITSVLSALIPLIAAIIIIIPLLVQPDVSALFGESRHFALTPQEIMQFPLAIWAGSGLILVIGHLVYLTPVAVVLMVLGIKRIAKDHRLILLLWILFPIIVTLISGKLFRFRYFAFTLPFTLIFVVAAIRSKPIRILTVLSFIIFSGLLVCSPRTFFAQFPTNVPRLMEREYTYDWTSGYGVRDVVRYVQDHLLMESDVSLVLAVPDMPGHPTDFLLANYFYHPRVHVVIATTTNEADFRKLEPIASKTPTYLVTRQGLLSPEIQPFLRPVSIFQSSPKEEFTGLYQVIF